MLSEINSLIEKSKFNQALQLIEDSHPSTEYDKISFGIAKTTILQGLGKKETSFQNLHKIEENFDLSKYPELVLRFNNAKIQSLTNSNQLEEALEIVSQSKAYLKTLPTPLTIPVQKELGILLKIEGRIEFLSGRLENSLTISNKALQILNDLNDKFNSIYALNVISLVYWNRGRLRKALGYQNQILEILKTLSLTHTQSYSNSCNNIGILYNALGDYTQGLLYHQKSLEIRTELLLESDIPTALINLGLTYFHLGAYDTSLKFLTQGYEKEQKFGNYFLISGVLFELIKINLKLQNQDLVTKYFKELEFILQDHEDDIRVNYRVKISRALILYEQPRMKDKIKAQELFEEILKLHIPSYELNILSIEKLLNLLFLEFKASEDEKVLQEIKSLLSRMSTIAEEQRSFSLFIQVLFLNAKLSVFEGDIVKAKKSLEQALAQAEGKNLDQLVKEIEIEIQKLTDLVNKWTNLANKGSSVFQYDKALLTKSYQFNVPKIHSIELEDDEIKKFTRMLEEIHS